MNKQREKILIAVLAGAVIAGAAAYAIQPGLASGPKFVAAAQANEPRIFDALGLEDVAPSLPVKDFGREHSPG